MRGLGPRTKLAGDDPSMLSISIVTPSLNQGAFINDCIQSVKPQFDEHTEHIVVDGGSTDFTLDVLRRYPHLRWISEPDAGQADALNKGFQMARGEVIGWLNADDTYVANTLEIVRRFFAKHPNVALTYGYVYVIDACGRRIRKRYSPDYSFDRLVRNGDCYVQPTFFLKRSMIESLGYLNPSQRCTMDYELILAAGRRFRVKKIPHCLGSFRIHAGSMSHSGQADARMRDAARAIQARYRPFVQTRLPDWVHRIEDVAVLSWFKAVGRIVSLPMYLRYRLTTWGAVE